MRAVRFHCAHDIRVENVPDPSAMGANQMIVKPIWCGILGVAAIIAFIVVFNPLSIFGIITVVAAGVYLVDVRPALRNITGGSQGPYGRW